MERAEIDTIVQDLQDLQLIMKIREARPKDKWDYFGKITMAQSVRLSQKFWAMDEVDLLALEKQLINRFLKAASIETILSKLI